MDIDLKITYRNDKLKAAREAAGLSQAQVAEITGVNVRVLQNFEQGVRDFNGAKLATILRVCNALSCKISDVVTDSTIIDLLADYENRDKKKM